MTQQGDKGEKPQLKISMLKEKKPQEEQEKPREDLPPYTPIIAILLIGIPLVVIALKLLQSSQSGSAVIQQVIVTATSVALPTTQALETPAANLTLAALETQNAILIQNSAKQPTAAPIAVIQPTKQVQVLTQILQPNRQDGTVFTCPTTGQYTISILSGVYSPFANGTGGKWRTFFMIYHNEPAVFLKNQYGYVAPAPGGNETQSIGNMELTGQTKEQAELAGTVLSVVTQCTQGEYLRFVAADEKGAYKDNFGTVTVRISIVS